MERDHRREKERGVKCEGRGIKWVQCWSFAVVDVHIQSWGNLRDLYSPLPEGSPVAVNVKP